MLYCAHLGARAGQLCCQPRLVGNACTVAAWPAHNAECRRVQATRLSASARASSSKADDEERLRVDAWLSRCGVCSRSEAAALLRAGRVRVAGAPASASQRCAASQVLVDGEPLEHPAGLSLLLNKSAGLVCSHDEREGPNVFSLLPPRWLRRTPALQTVGRLDKDTTGALLLTDDSQLLHALTSPRSSARKVYMVGYSGELAEHAEAAFADGRIVLDGSRCAPAELVRLDSGLAQVTLTEGRYHQVKRMLSAVGGKVTSLNRAAFAGWDVKGLEVGGWRVLSTSELAAKDGYGERDGATT